MTQGNGGHGIDSTSWRATILPLPKRHSRGAALGFCGGHVVGRVEAARGPSRGCWWPGGKPELLGLEGHKELGAGRAAGDLIPGNWRKDSGDMGAVVWRLNGTLLEGRELHDPAFAKTWATGAGGGAVIGIGARPSQPGKRTPNVGLVWRDGTDAAVIEAEGEVRLFATDGVRVAGSINGRAALWPAIGADPIDLSPAKMSMSEVEALDGDSQVGTAFKGFCARAGIWRGAAGTFSDLTPKGFQTSRAHGGAGGFQVGYVRVKENTGTGRRAPTTGRWCGKARRTGGSTSTPCCPRLTTRRSRWPSRSVGTSCVSVARPVRSR
ncbi:MAG: hypothetical protein IT352_11720 [Gemmatimonadales bacterium]|nr:hypothetical protein [Gemmatimonadales bacterium]